MCSHKFTIIAASMYHPRTLHMDLWHRDKSQKDKVIKRWRWLWSVSLLACISCLAGLSAVSPAISSARALPCQLARLPIALTFAATSREAETGHIKPVSHISCLYFFALHIIIIFTHMHMHTHIHVCVPIYTHANGWLHRNRDRDRQTCIFTQTHTVLNMLRDVLVVY